MKVKLKCLFLNGEALNIANPECTPEYTGNLVIEEWVSPYGCYVHQARLLNNETTARIYDIIPPLIDFEQLNKENSDIILRGYQITTDFKTGVSRQLRQEWVVHLLS